MTDRSLADQLRRQIGFMQRSADMYDNGYDDESIRIATAIRVLVHDTRSSTSLFTMLGVKASLTLLSTVEVDSYGT